MASPGSCSASLVRPPLLLTGPLVAEACSSPREIQQVLVVHRPPSQATPLGTGILRYLDAVCFHFGGAAQHLRIKRFFGTSENAVKTQIWIAVSVYVLVAIIKKKLQLDASLYTLLQILSVTLFKKMPLQQAFPAGEYIRSVQPTESIHDLTGQQC